MEKKTVITPEQLNNVPKDVLITMYLQLNGTLRSLTAQLEILTKQNASLEEKLAVLTQQHFGRKTEKTATFDGRQLVIDLDNMLILNEAEYTLESCIPAEPDMEEVIVCRKRQKSVNAGI